MRFVITIIMTGLITLTTNSQNKITGFVTDSQDQPVMATVYIPKLEKGTLCDLDGSYQIGNIPNGTYDIVYSSMAFETISMKLSFNNDQEVVNNVQLKESVVEMEEIIISTPFHKLQSENVMRVDKVTNSKLLSTGAINLSQGIDLIPGVNSISTGNGIGKPVIRGLSSNRVLTYTQGIRLENQQFGDEHGLGISNSGIESVEVIKGPASLLYGSDALGGVLYFNPEPFGRIGKTSVDINSGYFSNTLGSATNMGFRTSGEKFKFLIRGAYSTFSDYKTGSNLRVTNSRNNDFDIKSGIRFQNSTFKSTLRYNYNRSNLGLPESMGEQSTSKELLLPYQEIDNHILSLDNSFFFSESNLQVKLGFVHNDRREFEDEEDEAHYIYGKRVPDNEAALRMKLSTYTYDIKYTLPEMGKFETIAGIQGMIQNNENFGEEILIPDAQKFDLGLFATTHYHLETIDLQAGMRYDFRNIESDPARDPMAEDHIEAIDRNFNSFNAALGGKWNAGEKFIYRLNLASGFRAPNLSELASNGVHEGTNRYEIGNAALRNEQNIQVDLSAEYNDDHINVMVNGFYNSISDYIYLSPTGEVNDENPVYNYLQSNAELFGGEAGFHIHPHPLDWLHIETDFEMVIGKLKDGSDLPLIPAHKLSNTLRINFKDGKMIKEPDFFLTYSNTFDQDRTSTFETPTRGYDLLSLGGSLKINIDSFVIQLMANVTNLTDEDYISHLSRLKGDGISNMGRSYNLNLKIEL
jgi:iron complex outermembrane receptor protein